ncbi:MAG: ATP-grasp domain-containing protein [Steroidobacteraceae bacterium]
MTGTEGLRILVTDGDTRSALAATRSLGRQGHEVFVGGERTSTLSAASRYSAGAIEYPSPAGHPENFVASIVAAAESLPLDVVMPMTETTTALLARHREILPARCILPLAAATAIEFASDKSRVVELARELGVPIPATVTIASAAEATLAAGRLSFPVVVKPARSRPATGSGRTSSGVIYASDAEELWGRLAALKPEFFPLLLQERIYGPGVGIFACYDNGQAVAFFAHRRLREKPASGGVSVLRESVAPDPQAVLHARKLLERLGWHGVAMVEFKQDSRDGSLRLMEINGRFWGSLQLAIDAGVDFPAILLDVARGLSRQPVGSYRLGVRSRWFLGDLDAFLVTLFRRRSSLDLPPAFPSRARQILDFLHLWGPQLHYEVLRFDDPRPGLIELSRWLFKR